MPAVPNPQNTGVTMYNLTPGYFKVWKWLANGEVSKTVTNLLKLEHAESVVSIIIEYQTTAAAWNIIYTEI